MLADGSEYRGDYGVTVAELRRWHRPRLHLLAGTGADVLAAETIPCAAEVEALVTELAGSGVPAWISISARMYDGVACTAAGEPLAEVAAMMRGVHEIIAVGVNCCDPRPVADMVRAATRAAGKPGVAYPNSGETWDAAARAWTGSGSFTPALVAGWRDAGAALIGGCCRVEPEVIAAIRAGL
jgi:homocysteine S-methyltransferase